MLCLLQHTSEPFPFLAPFDNLLLFGHVGRQGSLPVLKVTFHLGLLGLVESPCGRAVAWHGQRQAKPQTLFHVVFGAKSCFQCQFYKVTDTDDSLIYKVTLRAGVLQPARPSHPIFIQKASQPISQPVFPVILLTTDQPLAMTLATKTRHPMLEAADA